MERVTLATAGAERIRDDGDATCTDADASYEFEPLDAEQQTSVSAA